MLLVDILIMTAFGDKTLTMLPYQCVFFLFFLGGGGGGGLIMTICVYMSLY